MKRTVIIYGTALAILIFVLRFLEYNYFIHDLSIEIYIASIALFFTGFGIWLGYKLIILKKETIDKPTSEKINSAFITEFGISKREVEVLQKISDGLTNQQIANELYVSLNTVKSHVSSIYSKLNVSRRTQAIQKAKKLNILI